MKKLLIPIALLGLNLTYSSCSTGTNEQAATQPADSVKSANAPATATTAVDSVKAAAESGEPAGEQEEEKEKEDKD